MYCVYAIGNVKIHVQGAADARFNRAIILRYFYLHDKLFFPFEPRTVPYKPYTTFENVL